MLTMTEADLRHLEDTSAPISDEERAQAAAEIRRCHGLLNAGQALSELIAAQPSGEKAYVAVAG